MNLLSEFVLYLPPAKSDELNALQTRGKQKEVWEAIRKQIKANKFDRDKILKELNISDAHFDKITSELLLKCYQTLFPDGSISLLNFLSSKGTYVKHFYHELKRQTKQAKKELRSDAISDFYKQCMNLLHSNLPIMHKDEKTIKELGENYIAYAPAKLKANAEFLVACRILYVQIDQEFAASTIKENEAKFVDKFKALPPIPTNADEELVFEYYWMHIYFRHALEQFDAVISEVEKAKKAMEQFSSELADTYQMKFILKQSEAFYYQSKFETAFIQFHRYIDSELLKRSSEFGYYTTKYIQVCLITNHLEEAKISINKMIVSQGERLKELIAIRDVINFIKYYLFNKEYNKAFEFIQLGFEKNPKAKYFQYEIELRNLQTACFFLSGNEVDAVEMCSRHIKFLRSHGYGIRDSDFPHFYVLIESIFNSNQTGKPLKAKEEQMLNRYQLGSYAVYGKLLQKMQVIKIK